MAEPLRIAGFDLRHWFKIVVSVFLLGLPVFFLLLASDHVKVAPLRPLLYYVGYVLACAALMTLVVGRLYRQHGFSRPKLDMASSLMVMAMIALPLWLADTFFDAVSYTHLTLPTKA